MIKQLSFKTVWIFLICGLFTNLLTAQAVFKEDFENTFQNWQYYSSDNVNHWLVGESYTQQSENWKIPSHSRFIAINDDQCNCNSLNTQLVSGNIHLNNPASLILKADVFFNGGAYQNDIEEAFVFIIHQTDTVFIDTLKGKNDWQTYFWNVSAFTSFDSIKIGFKYADNGGWLFGLALDNIELYTPISHDIKLSLNTDDHYYSLGSTLPLKGEISNLSADTLQNIYFNIQTADTFIQQKVINTINPFSSVQIAINYPIYHGSDTLLQTWVSDSLNLDQNKLNDSLSHAVLLLPVKNIQNTLIETFTSNRCANCYEIKEISDLYFENLAVNAFEGRFFLAQYHFNSILSNDDAYITENTFRKGLYGSLEDPYYIVNGQDDPQNLGFIQQNSAIRNIQTQTPFYVQLGHSLLNDSLRVNVQVKSQINLSSNRCKLWVIAIENWMFLNGMSAQDTSFKAVVRQFLSQEEGDAMPPVLKQDSVYAFAFTKKITIEKPVLFGSGSFTSVNEHNVFVMAFLQDTLTKEITQVNGSFWPLEVEEMPLNTGDIVVFPNPSNGDINIQIKANPSNTGVLELYDVYGKKVFEKSVFISNETLKMQFPSQVNGIYLLRVTSGNKIFSKQMVLLNNN